MVDIWKKLNEDIDQELTDSWKPQVNDELIGVYVSKKENVGRYHKNLYILKREDGEKIAVWGSTQIDREFITAQKGDKIKLVYLGKINNPKTGNSFHSYDVFVKTGEEPTTAKKKTTTKKDKNGDDIPF